MEIVGTVPPETRGAMVTSDISAAPRAPFQAHSHGRCGEAYQARASDFWDGVDPSEVVIIAVDHQDHAVHRRFEHQILLRPQPPCTLAWIPIDKNTCKWGFLLLRPHGKAIADMAAFEQLYDQALLWTHELLERLRPLCRPLHPSPRSPQQIEGHNAISPRRPLPY